jgi:peptide/nickel transport system substrate-binding protein
MSRSPSLRLRLFALLASAAIVVAACGGATTSASPNGTTAPPPSNPASAEPFDGLTYPESGEAPCAEAAAPDATHDAYKGNFKKIAATDAQTVVFDLCAPDVAFLSKIAFSSFAINDTQWLEDKIDPSLTENQPIISEVNGTGAYKLRTWNRGTDVTMEAFADYWGEKAKAQTLIIQWSTEAAQRLIALTARTVDGIDNIGPDDFATVEGNPDLQLKPRIGLNVLYLGFNNTFPPFDNEAVRQAIAKGIDKQRIVDNFMPAGSEPADYFTPCSIANGCEGEKWYEFDPSAAKQELEAANFDFSKTYKLHYRAAIRSYLANPPVVATDIQTQLQNNLGIKVDLDLQEDGAYIDNANAGKLDGFHLLGWGADYPDMTNFLDYHFGGGATPQFGDKFSDLTAILKQAAAGKSDADRQPLYAQANDLVRQHVPMIPISHAASGLAYLADVQNAHASPLGNELFAVMTPADRNQFVFVQAAEPKGLYCADESDGEALRVCEQMTEGLYGYEIGGVAAKPLLAEECAPNSELTQWTCTLRAGVKFHNGATLDANDVVLSFAVQWDADHALHKARTNGFSYFSGLFGGFLNPPVPKPA